MLLVLLLVVLSSSNDCILLLLGLLGQFRLFIYLSNLFFNCVLSFKVVFFTSIGWVSFPIFYGFGTVLSNNNILISSSSSICNALLNIWFMTHLILIRLLLVFTIICISHAHCKIHFIIVIFLLTLSLMFPVTLLLFFLFIFKSKLGLFYYSLLILNPFSFYCFVLRCLLSIILLLFRFSHLLHSCHFLIFIYSHPWIVVVPCLFGFFTYLFPSSFRRHFSLFFHRINILSHHILLIGISFFNLVFSTLY